jgi:hypothetical protein
VRPKQGRGCAAPREGGEGAAPRECDGSTAPGEGDESVMATRGNRRGPSIARVSCAECGKARRGRFNIQDKKINTCGYNILYLEGGGMHEKIQPVTGHACSLILVPPPP